LSSSVSSAAISIPPNLSQSTGGTDLLSEIVRARRRRRGRLWASLVAVGVVGVGVWVVSRHDLAGAIWGNHPNPATAATTSALAATPVAPAPPAAAPTPQAPAATSTPAPTNSR